jgi:hypothetical protein
MGEFLAELIILGTEVAVEWHAQGDRRDDAPSVPMPSLNRRKYGNMGFGRRFRRHPDPNPNQFRSVDSIHQMPPS